MIVRLQCIILDAIEDLVGACEANGLSIDQERSEHVQCKLEAQFNAGRVGVDEFKKATVRLSAITNYNPI